MHANLIVDVVSNNGAVSTNIQLDATSSDASKHHVRIPDAMSIPLSEARRLARFILDNTPETP